MKQINKRGLSTMIGYVLLVSITIILSGLVYQWAKTYVPADAVECSEGVYVFVKSSIYNCNTNQLNLTIKNNGRFSIGGYSIRAANSSNQSIATIDLSQYTFLGSGKGAVIPIDSVNSIKPDDEIFNSFNLSTTSFGQIKFIDIIPIMYENNQRVNCGNAKLKEVLSCS